MGIRCSAVTNNGGRIQAKKRLRCIFWVDENDGRKHILEGELKGIHH